MTFHISVIIPTFNSASYLRPAIESVLNQTKPPFEIIVVDDGSKDDSVRIASSYGINVIEKEHQGISATRNRGIQHSTGNYLSFLDADDVWETTKLEKQMSFIENNPKIQGVFTYLQQFISQDLPTSEQNQYACPSQAQAGYHAGCLMISREAFLQVGLFSEALTSGEFIEWYIRAQQKGILFDILSETLMYRRIHGKNTTLAAPNQTYAEYLKIIRMKLKSCPQ